MTSRHESTIDRRLFLGATGALLAGQQALAQEAKSEAKPAVAKRLSDTIADFVVGFDATRLPPLAVERTRLAFVDTFAVMLAGSREEGAGIVCEMVQQEGAAPRVSVVGQSFRTSPQLAALANGVAAHIMDYDFSSLLGQPTSPIIPALLPLAESIGAAARRGDGGVHRRLRGVPEACPRGA
jgi:2-methylcitrate dehydratase PrpD